MSNQINALFVSGASMAAAWVTLQHLGQDGYIKIAKNLQNTVQILIRGVNNIEVRAFFHKSTVSMGHILEWKYYWWVSEKIKKSSCGQWLELLFFSLGCTTPNMINHRLAPAATENIHSQQLFP